MEGAVVHRRLAEEADRHLIAALVLDRERGAGDQRDVPGDDRVPAEEALLAVEDMHRAALAARTPGRLPEQLGHHGPRADAARQRLPVLAVAAHDQVVVAQRRHRADGHGLLADIEVAEPPDLAERVLLARPLLEAPDEEHVAQQLPQRRGVLAGEVLGGRRGRGPR
ncbi:MAG: hypothetical protein A2083_04945 [Gemmatimonadetes bacterium GWC2_71_9]|nr:MAG: hypothetical protein A2083_04945 [Gemmatimonadetes bacterium GWC2_71_9]